MGLTADASHSGAQSLFAIELVVRRPGIWAYLLLRWLGAWIDFIVLIFFLALPDFALGNSVYQATIWIWLIAPLAYFPVSEGIWGRSLGKLVTGTMVVDDAGRAPGIWRAALRTLTRLLEVNPLLIGGLPAGIAVAMSQRRQRLGDMLARTYVVRLKDLQALRQTSDVFI